MWRRVWEDQERKGALKAKKLGLKASKEARHMKVEVRRVSGRAGNHHVIQGI